MKKTNLPKLIVFDFDGVLTDNRVLVFSDGLEAVYCNRSDGLGIGLLRKAGIPSMILSMETNPVVKARADKLKIKSIQGEANKAERLTKLAKEMKISLKDIMYVGNDLNDIGPMKLVGYPVCPKDAHAKVKKISSWVLKSKGGEGVAREIAVRLGVA